MADITGSVVDTVHRKIAEVQDGSHSVGVVQAVTDNRVSVDIAGSVMDLAYLSSYTPTAGDVVQVMGKPGARFVLGKLRGAGPDPVQARTAYVASDVNIGGNARAVLFATPNGSWMGDFHLALPGGDVSTDPNGMMHSLHFFGGTFHGVLDGSVAPASDSAMKREFRPVDDAEVDHVMRAPVRGWKHLPRPDYGDSDPPEQVSACAEDLPASARRWDETEQIHRFDMQSYIGYLHAAIQRQERRINALEGRGSDGEG